MNLASLIDNACYTSAPETFFCQSVLGLGKATAKWHFSGGACEPDYARGHPPSRHRREKVSYERL